MRVGTDHDVFVTLLINRRIFGPIKGTSGVTWEQKSSPADQRGGDD